MMSEPLVAVILGTDSAVRAEVVVLTWRDEFGPVFYLMTTVWALLDAFVLLREALQKRAESRHKKLAR
jgi:hypothetical protein